MKIIDNLLMQLFNFIHVILFLGGIIIILVNAFFHDLIVFYYLLGAVFVLVALLVGRR
ncbi:hypothetical protein [Macrococcoides caseolyticum]|uniref:hypothetical protein n=1 Tax=Macrococcoides caseolyticum TaxID=69966 RepID=UPI000A28E479|nr:hypothetical protein [Macrococcus caseolyticus]ARQ04390.1 hypothetical protein CA207_11390 [Macrococcus caseolyticus]MDJ1108591.1 hypothetical protein [Macrococcus caseolyticus]